MRLPAPLQTERLLLRTLDESNVGAAYPAWLLDPDVIRHLEARFAKHDAESCRAFVASANSQPDIMLLGIFLRDGDHHIGNIKLGPINRHHRRAELGLLIGTRSEWGKGYAVEAIAAVTRHAFNSLGLHKVTAGCYSGNIGSLRAFLKAGYIEVARRKQHWLADGAWQDDIMLERLKPAALPTAEPPATGDRT